MVLGLTGNVLLGDDSQDNLGVKWCSGRGRGRGRGRGSGGGGGGGGGGGSVLPD